MKNFVLKYIAVFILLLIRLTCRFKFHFENPSDEKTIRDSLEIVTPSMNHRFVLAFFHQDEMCLIPPFAFCGIGVLASASKDGQLIASISKILGYHPVEGSSSKKAVAGLLSAIKMVNKGRKFSIAVDGPRGPLFEVKPGVIAISEKTKIPIMPVRAYPEKCKIFHKSWNKAKLPYLFTRIDIVIGQVKAYTREELQEKMKSLKV